MIDKIKNFLIDKSGILNLDPTNILWMIIFLLTSLLIIFIIYHVLASIVSFIFSRKMKGGIKKGKMPRKKKESVDDFDMAFIPELDADEEDIEQPPEDSNFSSDLKAIYAELEKHEKAITVNQKYIKKIWEKVKEIEDNFRLLYESK